MYSRCRTLSFAVMKIFWAVSMVVCGVGVGD